MAFSVECCAAGFHQGCEHGKRKGGRLLFCFLFTDYRPSFDVQRAPSGIDYSVVYVLLGKRARAFGGYRKGRGRAEKGDVTI